MVALVFVAFAALLVWRYATYRMSSDCDSLSLNALFQPICTLDLMRRRAAILTSNTMNLSIVTAVFLNLFYWLFFGRSNPPGSSDSIYVYGMDDSVAG